MTDATRTLVVGEAGASSGGRTTLDLGEQVADDRAVDSDTEWSQRRSRTRRTGFWLTFVGLLVGFGTMGALILASFGEKMCSSSGGSTDCSAASSRTLLVAAQAVGALTVVIVVIGVLLLVREPPMFERPPKHRHRHRW